MKIYKFDTLDSTNEYMKNHMETFEEFDAVIADSQTKGKARRGNLWFSDKGMALFTFLVKKHKGIKDSEYMKLPLLAGMGVIKGLNHFEKLDYKFKWTNDVYLNERKLSGILVERIEDNFYIGIGININNILPVELEKIAVSLSEITGEKYDITDIVSSIIKEFKILYNDFINRLWKNILSEINSINYLKDKKVSIKIADTLISGIARDINNKGEIEILANNGILSFSFGEVVNKKIIIEK
ncbi:biotin--[acetyl-CoA-carboxylase] ligase [Leptotrichia sp. OH3620_COT-345]|uniref:biotin--[acetyl-CoA-carboxylase] ligase n=1 Tax=Leptotrichia sp. OH3620_COT-345 TaxID=2491048 RepID=UPI000F6482A5|nr:biotin--[acetyl-CoA-carboxylase] ligase [Leptotrichia sp. OH3620_COT-345]RRD40695.1 biotin--[acetyl-CoA-carboxylase] ligase [Leptotrichia sp. OH3620_COT-345]